MKVRHVTVISPLCVGLIVNWSITTLNMPFHVPAPPPLLPPSFREKNMFWHNPLRFIQPEAMVNQPWLR